MLVDYLPGLDVTALEYTLSKDSFKTHSKNKLLVFSNIHESKKWVTSY